MANFLSQWNNVSEKIENVHVMREPFCSNSKSVEMLNGKRYDFSS